MDIYSSTHLPTYLSTHLSTHLPTYPSIHLSTYLPIYLPTHLPPCGFNLLILGVHIRSCRINKVPLTERANYTKLKLPEIAASPLGFLIFLASFSPHKNPSRGPTHPPTHPPPRHRLKKQMPRGVRLHFDTDCYHEFIQPLPCQALLCLKTPQALENLVHRLKLVSCAKTHLSHNN